jgi:CheY-like chemotaxis protein
METLGLTPPLEQLADEPRVVLLLADDDARLRELFAYRAREAVASLTVLEAEDGAEALRIGLERRPRLALLDVRMPRLDGIEVAVALRRLEPRIRLALHSADLPAHRDQAREHGLPLFDKLDGDPAIRWLERQARALADRGPARPSQKLNLECAVCGYTVARRFSLDRCPFCRSAEAWTHAPWRPFSARLPPNR